jgi:hypothetical protein
MYTPFTASGSPELVLLVEYAGAQDTKIRERSKGRSFMF